MKTILKRIKKAREKAGFTKREMASRLDISESYYHRLENGERRMSLKLALDIASILHKTPNELFLPSNFTKREKTAS